MRLVTSIRNTLQHHLVDCFHVRVFFPRRSFHHVSCNVALEVVLRGSDVLLQDYINGIAGGDVTPQAIDTIVDDLNARAKSCEPLWQEVAV